MARTIVKLAIFLLFVHALYRFVPIYYHHQQFKDAVNETALFDRRKSDAEILERVMQHAEKYKIPLQREDVQVRREHQDVFIDASYVEVIEWLPTYKRPWQFTVGARTVSDLRATSPRTPGG